jgi:hypothetical protein
MRYIVLIALLILTSCNREVTPVLKSVHPYLKPYYTEFMELTGHVNTSEVIMVEFSKLMPKGVLGIALGMNADTTVLVKINTIHWNELSENQKWWLVMHELAHDILNWEHGKNRLMYTPMPWFVSDLMIAEAKRDLKQ